MDVSWSYECVLAKKVITQLYVLSELASTHQPSQYYPPLRSVHTGSWRAASGLTSAGGHPGVGALVPPPN